MRLMEKIIDRMNKIYWIYVYSVYPVQKVIFYQIKMAFLPENTEAALADGLAPFRRSYRGGYILDYITMIVFGEVQFASPQGRFQSPIFVSLRAFFAKQSFCLPERLLRCARNDMAADRLFRHDFRLWKCPSKSTNLQA